MSKKREVDIRLILIIAVIFFILFGPKPVSYGEAGRIARETLYNDQALAGIRTRIMIDLTNIADEGTHWRVQASIVCQRNAEFCTPDALRARGIAPTYTIMVDKTTGESVIAYPYYSA